MEQAKQCIAVYCKAQSQLNTIGKNNESLKKQTLERIKTCKSLLIDEFVKQDISCLEVKVEEEATSMFIRMKQNISNIQLKPDDIVSVLEQEIANIADYADGQEYDIPKMLVRIIEAHIKQRRQGQNKLSTLTFTSCKERGVLVHDISALPSDLQELAHSLIKYVQLLKRTRTTEKDEKTVILQQQKSVEEDVKIALTHHDPERKTQKIYINQEGNRSVYYLRCKDQKAKISIGIRKITPVIQDAANTCLQRLGLSREFMPTTPLPRTFWDDVMKEIKHNLEKLDLNTKTISKLTLDKAAGGRHR